MAVPGSPGDDLANVIGRGRTNDGERVALDESTEIRGARGERGLGRFDAETANRLEFDQGVEDRACHAPLTNVLLDNVASMCASRSVASRLIVANVCSTTASTSVSASLGTASEASSDSQVCWRIS